MRSQKLLLLAIFMASLFSFNGGQQVHTVEAETKVAGKLGSYHREETISSIWPPSIQRWSPEIVYASRLHGLDPDFIAAVITAESNGIATSISSVGAVGLMGVMPYSETFSRRPSTELLLDPKTNIRWGGAILSEVIRQSGGDLSAALAAYNGGWPQINLDVPRNYAASILNNYGRAVAIRSGISPDISTHWTVAVEVRPNGYIPNENLLIGQKPLSGLHKYGEHWVYNYIDQNGRPHYFKGYAVPLALIEPLPTTSSSLSPTVVEGDLMHRIGLNQPTKQNSNPQILLTCLPSLNRLRGRLSTRWYAPSQCPTWYRLRK